MSKPGPLCHLCPLKDSAGPVWGVGPSSAKLAIIGQNPERTEVETQIPFSGVSGEKLNLECTTAGISRSSSFVTNVVKCFVKAGQPVPPKALKCCYPLLEQELASLDRCKTYLTLGGPAFSIFSGKRLLTTTDAKGKYKKDPNVWLRGCPYIISHTAKKAIIPTVHPAYLGYTGNKDKFLFQADLRKAKRFLEGEGVFTEPVSNYKPTSHEVEEQVVECIAKGDVGVDIETSEQVVADENELVGTAQGEIEVIGISCNIGEAMGIPPDLFPLLKPLFLANINLFAYNGLFDFYHIRAHFTMKCRQIDAMLELHELHSDFSAKNLAIALSLYTDMPFHKNLAKSQPDLYNCMDTYGVLWAGLNMLTEIERLGCTWHFFKYTNAGLPICEALRLKGPKANVPLAENMELICYKALQKYDGYFSKLLPGISWNSPKQLQPVFQQLKLPARFRMRKDRKTGARKRTATVDEKVLIEYRDKFSNQLAGLILLMRRLKKASDFTHLYQPDGFVHATYGMHFQKQGRIQTRNPDLQNTPSGLVPAGKDKQGAEQYLVRPREIVIPDSDSDNIIVADFAQIELRLYAIQANERVLLDEIDAGTYIYGIVYETIYKRNFFLPGKPRQKQFKAPHVTAKELLVAKTAPLGWIYGREDYTETGMSVEESKLFGKLMHSTYPAISEFQSKLGREARLKGYLRNPFNRIRPVANPYFMRTEYLSFMGQGTAVDVLLRNALIPLYKGLRQFGESCRLIFTVYDSIGVNCPKDTTKDCIEFIRESMEAPFEELGGRFIPAEISSGPSWGECE